VINSTVSGSVNVSEGIRDLGNIKVAVGSSTSGADQGVYVRGELVVADGGISFPAGGGQIGVASVTGLSGVTEGLVDVTGPIRGYNLIQVGRAQGNSTTTSKGTFIARHSSIELDETNSLMAVGIVTGSDSPIGNGLLELVSSFVQIPASDSKNRLWVDDGGTVNLHLQGLTRADDVNVHRETPIYSAMDVNHVDLECVIQADFDFVPPAGAHTFDLLIAQSLDASATAVFQVLDLPEGFAVDFFGVTQADFGEGSVDVVRLAVSGVPEPSLTILLVSGVIVAITYGRRRKEPFHEEVP
jgi:hypothetical protein